jgi:hypothetical protein
MYSVVAGRGKSRREGGSPEIEKIGENFLLNRENWRKVFSEIVKSKKALA